MFAGTDVPLIFLETGSQRGVWEEEQEIQVLELESWPSQQLVKRINSLLGLLFPVYKMGMILLALCGCDKDNIR